MECGTPRCSPGDLIASPPIIRLLAVGDVTRQATEPPRTQPRDPGTPRRRARAVRAWGSGFFAQKSALS
ncbi:unnamed protein product [Lota lota]